MTAPIQGNLPGSPSRGRPRAAGVDERVLEATRRVVAEHGYDETTVDGIARAAGVSKGSIYRRWPSKGVLVYDACLASSDELPQIIDSGDIRADLVAVATLTAQSFRERGRHGIFQSVVADAQRDPALMELLRTRFFAPRSDAIVRRVELAIERGELRGDLNVELVPALINGSQQYLLGVRERVLDDAELRELIDLIIGSHVIARPPAGTASP